MRSNTGVWIRILEPRPPSGYKVDILLANRHNKRSSFTKNLLEPKSHLALAITYKILAIHKSSQIPVHQLRFSNVYLNIYFRVDISSANITFERSSTRPNVLDPKSYLVLVITYEILAL